MAAYRRKYAPQQVGEGTVYLPVEDMKDPGTYMTDGFVFHYEHIAKLPRQSPEPDADLSEPLPNPNGELQEALAGAEDEGG
jgi:hypothetical protein